jgi:hypothetical protein
MPFGRKGPKMTGADYLMYMADDAMKSGLPYAERFQHMVMQAFGDEHEAMLTTELVAQRPLKDHESTPVSVILSAYKAASKGGDVESRGEVFLTGLMLLAKWPEYLAFGTEHHPTLEWKRAENTSDP